MLQAEKKRYNNENCYIHNADREDILHWQQAKDYYKISLNIEQTKEKINTLDMEDILRSCMKNFVLKSKQRFKKILKFLAMSVMLK